MHFIPYYKFPIYSGLLKEPVKIDLLDNLVTNYMSISVYDIGRVCVKTMGREAGNHCVIVDIVDKNYLLIDGLKVRRRRINYKHVVPLEDIIEIKKGATHADVEAAIKKAKLTEKRKEHIEIPKK